MLFEANIIIHRLTLIYELCHGAVMAKVPTICLNVKPNAPVYLSKKGTFVNQSTVKGSHTNRFNQWLTVSTNCAVPEAKSVKLGDSVLYTPYVCGN